MPKVTVGYDTVTPPIKSVTLELTAKEAIVLTALLGSFGVEYTTSEIYRELVTKTKMDAWGSPMHEQYQNQLEMAKKAIHVRSNLNTR